MILTYMRTAQFIELYYNQFDSDRKALAGLYVSRVTRHSTATLRNMSEDDD